MHSGVESQYLFLLALCSMLFACYYAVVFGHATLQLKTEHYYRLIFLLNGSSVWSLES